MDQHPHYKEGETSTIKCYFEDDTEDGFRAEGLLHENVKVSFDPDIKYEINTDIGFWYKLTGKVEDVDGHSLVIRIDDDENIEKIGKRIDDWLEPERNKNVNIKSLRESGGPMSKTLSSGSKRFFSAGSHSSQSLSVDSVDKNSLRSSPDVNYSVDEAGLDQSDMSGFATGGGKDINNFRDNIKNGFRPHPDSLTYEGIFYDYEFDLTGDSKDSLFYPVYEQAVTTNHRNDSAEHYLAVGLESGMSSFERPNLDLMLVVDISGSMGRDMNKYYYDNSNNRSSKSSEKVSKMEATRRVLKGVISNLDESDRFGVVLYNNQGWVSKPLRLVNRTDVDAILDHVDDLEDGGGTDMMDGYNKAVQEMDQYAQINTEDMERESRIIFLTDAMPNTGETDRFEIADLMEENSEKGIHTTFVGIGVDANPDLITQLSDIKGSNHYFVDSEEKFEERIVDEFEYVTTPLVFDLKLTIEGSNFNINGVYGSPNENAETDGNVMNVKTLFPSTGKEGTKGGVILIELESQSPEPEVRISASWNERDGTENADVRKVNINRYNPEYFSSDEIKKAVVLKRYVEELREWLIKEEDRENVSEWERTSNPLNISEENAENIRDLRSYMYDNKEIFTDEFTKEIELIDLILDQSSS